MRAGFFRGVILPADIIQQVIRVHFGRVDGLLCIRQDLFGKPELFGDQQRVGASRQTNRQVICRSQCFQVKFHRSISHARCGLGKELEFGKVRRCEAGYMMVHDILHDGTGEGRPFLRVGAGAQFVEQHQRLSVGTVEDANLIGHVSGEGRKRLFNGLFVADIGKDILKR